MTRDLPDNVFQIGETVILLSPIGDYPAGTEAVVVSVMGDSCEIEIEPQRRMTIDCNDLALTCAS
jgi:hypothetical protein